MVYRRLSVRQAEQERAALERDWMTLLEGIELIKHVDAESKIEVPQSPHEQICDAIEDLDLRARWLDEASRPPFGWSPLGWIPSKPEDFPLRKRRVRLQNGGEIHWGRRRWRALLLLREDMKRLFSKASDDSGSTKALQRISNNERGKQIMHEAISAIYDLAETQGVKPPNIVEVRKLAPRWLEKHKDIAVHTSWIEKLAADPRYQGRRGKSGVTLKGRLRPVSELQI